MILLKLLGFIDLLSALTFLLLIFGITPYLHLTLFCAGLLLLKGMFIITGDLLSVIDIVASLILLSSLVLLPSTLFLWVPSCLLLAKGVGSLF
jgi:hypothetical protein